MSTWAARPSAPGLVPILAPRGDLDDSNTISATQALAGDQSAHRTLAQRYNAGDVMVAGRRYRGRPRRQAQSCLVGHPLRRGAPQTFKDQIGEAMPPISTR